MPDWKAIHQKNRRASARKAKRERTEAARKARVEAAGGVIAVGELKAAVREMRRCRDIAYQRDFDCEVWTFRGREWAMVSCLDDVTVVAVPHTPHCQTADTKNAVPLTAGAAKWVRAQWEAQAAAE